jgi:hypothetical protein
MDQADLFAYVTLMLTLIEEQSKAINAVVSNILPMLIQTEHVFAITEENMTQVPMPVFAIQISTIT